ncbi:MAG: peroxidase-related enzyme [Pseudomonadota bacterium]|nr:peroxidase-related enzyme [Pseudomonadota bacterium]
MANFSYSRNFKGVADVFLRSPKLYKPLLAFFENVMVGESGLSKEEREVIATHVSRINGCHFCVEAHRATLTAMGVDEATVSTLELGPNIDGVSDQVKDLLIFSEKLTRTPAEVTITDIDALKNKGVSEQTIEDTINVVSLLNYLNRLVDAFGVEGGPDYFKMVGTSLAKNGYAALIP